MRRRSLYFTAPYQVQLRDEELTGPGPNQLLVTTLVSAISPGTELLIYRGQAPTDLAADETLAALTGSLAYPLKYGYAAVGRVSAVGPGVDPSWLERTVLAFNPHESHFLARPADVWPIEGEPTAACFLPNLETAVNLLLDGQPLIGEQVVVIGQGVVGLLTTGLLARLPLGGLTTIEPLAARQRRSLAWGATASLAPDDGPALAALRQQLAALPAGGADLVYELSGNPAALELAIALTGYSGRVVVGSWYGTRPATLTLGGRFHRSKLQIIASQVSRVAPIHSGRWTPTRRLATAAALLPSLPVVDLISHRLPLAAAARAYRLLDQSPQTTLAVVVSYAPGEGE